LPSVSAMASSAIHSSTDFVAREVALLRHSVEHLKQEGNSIRRITAILVGGFLLSGAIVIYNWETVKKKVGHEGAEVIREGMQNERLQFTAHEFSRQLLNDFLNDEALRVEVSNWLLMILNDSENELGRLVVRTLQSEAVTSEVLRISENIVSWLCYNTTVQQQVSDLLLVAINLPSARQGAADWLIDLINREDVSEALKKLVNEAVLEDNTVRKHAASLARHVTSEVLNDPSTMRITQERLSQVLADPQFQSQASDAVWSLVRLAFRRPSWFGSSISADPSHKIQPLSPT